MSTENNIFRVEKIIREGDLLCGVNGGKVHPPFIEIENVFGPTIKVGDRRGDNGIFMFETKDEIQSVIDKLNELKEEFENGK